MGASLVYPFRGSATSELKLYMQGDILYISRPGSTFSGMINYPLYHLGTGGLYKARYKANTRQGQSLPLAYRAPNQKSLSC